MMPRYAGYDTVAFDKCYNSLDKVKTNWESSAVQNLIKGLMIFIRQIQDEYYNENTWISRLSIYDSDTNEGSWEMSGVISRVDR